MNDNILNKLVEKFFKYVIYNKLITIYYIIYMFHLFVTECTDRFVIRKIAKFNRLIKNWVIDNDMRWNLNNFEKIT